MAFTVFHTEEYIHTAWHTCVTHPALRSMRPSESSFFPSPVDILHTLHERCYSGRRYGICGKQDSTPQATAPPVLPSTAKHVNLVPVEIIPFTGIPGLVLGSVYPQLYQLLDIHAQAEAFHPLGIISNDESKIYIKTFIASFEEWQHRHQGTRWLRPRSKL
ncbi:hypothetical protein BKA93DRAFT_748529 [Sparassis latifolia]